MGVGKAIDYTILIASLFLTIWIIYRGWSLFKLHELPLYRTSVLICSLFPLIPGIRSITKKSESVVVRRFRLLCALIFCSVALINTLILLEIGGIAVERFFMGPFAFLMVFSAGMLFVDSPVTYYPLVDGRGILYNLLIACSLIFLLYIGSTVYVERIPLFSEPICTFVFFISLLVFLPPLYYLLATRKTSEIF